MNPDIKQEWLAWLLETMRKEWTMEVNVNATIRIRLGSADGTQSHRDGKFVPADSRSIVPLLAQFRDKLPTLKVRESDQSAN